MTDKNELAVKTEDLWKVFVHEAEEVRAVAGVDLTIERAEFTALAGPSGSGKTTLLNMIGGLTRPSRGRVWIAGRDITEMSNRELAELRLQQVGFVFQAYNLLPVLTALENAEFPLVLRGMEETERAQRVQELFQRTGLGLEDRRPGKLSGGQQQRVAVIRAVVGRPALVLADEPTANLDSAASESLLQMMEELNREQGTTFVFATHDPRVMHHSRRLIRLVDGRIASDEKR
jgi:putative ABC transport system ATP-binding protein